MKHVKIYGERNTGIIALEFLVKKNLDAVISDTFDLGWKHRVAPSDDELSEKIKKDVIFLCLVKNPYSWLLSMHKHPGHHEALKKLSFSEFLRYSYGDYRNPIVMWNIKYNSYVNLANSVENHIIVKYEDMLTDQVEFVNLIAGKFGFDKPVFFKHANKRLSNSKKVSSRRFRSEYYIEEKWRRKLHRRHVNYINEFLDKNLMEKFNYSYI